MRVPTINVSLVDLTFTPKRATTVAEINGMMKAAAAGPLARRARPTPRSRWYRSITTTMRTPRTFDGHHDQGDRRRPREGLRLVRQRVGFSNRMLDTTARAGRTRS
jgi:glyceraldehyde-3-phosphate dehydrogenase/erythrose-4-phosphate dehydrogenase